MRTINIFTFLVFVLTPTTIHAVDELPVQSQQLLDASHAINLKSNKKSGDEEAEQLRINAISIEAYSWGMKEAVYYRTNFIQDLLEQNSFTLNKTINIGKFVVDGKMLMPTVLEAERIYIKNHDREARSVTMSYTLDKPPRIVSQPPTWRDYLKRTIPKPEAPIKQAHPKNKTEIKVWDAQFKRGWIRGIEQANNIYFDDLNKLKNELGGLYRFRYLLAQNIVTLPELSKDEVGVMMLDSGKTINLNDVKYKITLDSQFKKVSEWKPVFRQGSAHE